MTAAALNQNLFWTVAAAIFQMCPKSQGGQLHSIPHCPQSGAPANRGNHIFSAYFFIWSLFWLYTSLRKAFLTTVLCLNFVWGGITLFFFYTFWNLCYVLRKAFPRMGKMHLLLFLLIFYCFLFLCLQFSLLSTEQAREGCIENLDRYTEVILYSKFILLLNMCSYLSSR